MSSETKSIELNGSEARQLFHGVEFALKDFWKGKKEGILDGFMSPQEIAETEDKLRALQHKMMVFAWTFPENN